MPPSRVSSVLVPEAAADLSVPAGRKVSLRPENGKRPACENTYPTIR